MKYNSSLLTILIILIANTILLSQTEWEKIILTERHADYPNRYHYKYQILKTDLKLTHINRPDSVIQKVEIETINNLLHAINTKALTEEDPLTAFGRDSTWLIENAERLWRDYLDGDDKIEEINKFTIPTLKDYTKVRDVILFMLEESIEAGEYSDYFQYGEYIEFNENNCKVVRLTIINKNDTLDLYTIGNYPYMLPWYNKKIANINEEEGIVYNANISKYTAQLLPQQGSFNKNLLSGLRFDYYLIDRLNEFLLQDTIESIKAKIKYPNSFRKLEQHFKVIDAKMAFMNPTGWDNFASWLEIILIDTAVSKNIHFSTMFGRRLFLYPVTSIIKKKLLKQLENNSVYNYALHCKDCIGEIQFVNGKSFGKKTKRSFLEDVEENNLSTKVFKGKFKDAILFTLIENRNDERSFSEWIFLKDGTYILWYINGDYLMNLPQSIIQKKGSVCKIISADFFSRAVKF